MGAEHSTDPKRRARAELPRGLLILVGTILIVAIAATVALVLWPREKSSSPTTDTVEEILKYAPWGSIGVVHFDVERLRNSVFRELRETHLAFPPAGIEAAERLAAKVKSADLFFVISGPSQKFLPSAIVHGQLTREDLDAAAAAFGPSDAGFSSVGNGRYDLLYGSTAIRVVLGDEAPDLEGGVSVIGPRLLLTGAFVEDIGSGAAGSLRELLARTDTSAPIFGGGEFSDPARGAPKRIFGSIAGQAQGTTSIVIEFRSVESAAEMEEVFGGGDSAFLQVFRVEREGKVLTVKARSEREIIRRMLEAMVRFRTLAKRSMSAANLYKIGKAIALYGAVHGGKFPSNMGELVTGRLVTVELLISPSGDTPEEGWDPKSGRVPEDYVYVYYPSGVAGVPEPSKWVLAYEKPEFNGGEGTNVLYVVGPVSFVALDVFRRQLERTEQWLASRP